MYDPMHVVYDVKLPIPKREKLYDAKCGEPRWTLGISRRTNQANLGQRTYAWWNLSGYKPRLAGRSFGWTRLLTIWHNEPGGADSGTVCGHKDAKRHPQHWTFQWHHSQRLRRWIFTRCEWCGGPSRKGDVVNISHQWDRSRPKRFWQSERGLFHQDCSSISRAHKTCLCGLGPWAQGDSGKCASCGKSKVWRSGNIDPADPGDEPKRILASIPTGQRDRRKYGQASRIWKDWNETRRVLERLSEDVNA